MGSAISRVEANGLSAPNSIKPPHGVPLVFAEHIHFTFAFSNLQTYPSTMQRTATPAGELFTSVLFTTVEPPHDHPMLLDLPAYVFASNLVQSPPCFTKSTGKRIRSPSSLFC